MTMPSDNEFLEAFEELVERVQYLLDEKFSLVGITAYDGTRLDKCDALIEKIKKAREEKEASHRAFKAWRKEEFGFSSDLPNSEGEQP